MIGSLVGLEVGAVVLSGPCVGKGVMGGGVAGADVILGALQVSSEAGSKFSCGSINDGIKHIQVMVS